MSDINWREELLDSAKFNQKEDKFLKDGPKSLTDSWFLSALYTRWKKMKGYREPPTSNYQSSFLEWEHRLAKGEFYVLTEKDFSYPDW
ncbi:hypothetical protein [Prochlorococcus marinus]|uniref:hypothetical protein n=1 Tax=Prochlorococcus marinus TaxID=1219 RepID=UPI0022B3E430|nr:hypothetical protein [Prochlorococcus marinus]